MREKKCCNCERWYIGEGVKGFCTSECFYKVEYSKIHQCKPKRVEKPKSALVKKRRTPLAEINANWIEKPYIKEPASKHKIQEKMEWKRTYPEPSCMKKFKACRG